MNKKSGAFLARMGSDFEWRGVVWLGGEHSFVVTTLAFFVVSIVFPGCLPLVF